MTRMYSEKGGYMDCMTAKGVEKLKAKGWSVVVEKPVKKAVKKVAKKQAKK